MNTLPVLLTHTQTHTLHVAHPSHYQFTGPSSFSAQKAPVSHVRLPGAATELNQGFPCFGRGGGRRDQCLGPPPQDGASVRKYVSAPQKHGPMPITACHHLRHCISSFRGRWQCSVLGSDPPLSQPRRPPMCLPAGVPGVFPFGPLQSPPACPNYHRNANIPAL